MKQSFRFCGIAALLAGGLVLSSLPARSAGDPPPNQITPEESKAGWKLLFDGHSLKGWRSYGKPSGPDHGWVVEDGSLNCVAHAKGGDIVSVDQFTDFDLQWDWRIPAGANNGLKYMVTEKRPSAPGQEYQMIDDSIAAAKPEKWSTASFYDVLAPDPKKILHPPGEWNHSRILVKGSHVEHWLNGQKVLAYELGSPEIKAAVASSKFKNSPGFGDKITGPILLTEHEDAASFRAIKILELKD